MANISGGTNTSSSVASASLSMLTEEATSLLNQAKAYRTEMEALPENDERRALYEQVIRDLLDRSKRLSSFLVTEASK